MPPMPDPLPPDTIVAASRTASDLLPFLAVMLAGFLVGAWGQSAKLPIAVIAGMALIILAVGGFFIENSSGPDQTP
jgi:hypothetical protein